jgi:dTMP kinase
MQDLDRKSGGRVRWRARPSDPPVRVADVESLGSERAARTAPNARFVVLEGGEGSGKSTLGAALGASLRAAGHEVVLTREPGGTALGTGIRALLLDQQDAVVDPRAEALLYAADRAQHVAEVIRPALDRGAVVISDRHVDSSLAYQGAGRALDTAEVAQLSRWAVSGGLVPGLTVLLDVDPAVGLVRAGRVDAPDRLESEPLEFHQRVRAGFLALAAADPLRYLVLDATQDRDAVAAEAGRAVAVLVGDPAPAGER